MLQPVAATAWLALTLATACASKAAPPPAPATAAPAPAPPTHVTLTFAAEVFAPESEIRVEVWNEAQLARRDRAGACVVRREGTTCPGGAPYTPPTPEARTFKVSALTRPLQFDAASLQPGERYEISLAGRSAEPCAHLVGKARGVVASDSLVTANLRLATLDARCPPGA